MVPVLARQRWRLTSSQSPSPPEWFALVFDFIIESFIAIRLFFLYISICSFDRSFVDFAISISRERTKSKCVYLNIDAILFVFFFLLSFCWNFWYKLILFIESSWGFVCVCLLSCLLARYFAPSPSYSKMLLVLIFRSFFLILLCLHFFPVRCVYFFFVCRRRCCCCDSRFLHWARLLIFCGLFAMIFYLLNFNEVFYKYSVVYIYIFSAHEKREES